MNPAFKSPPLSKAHLTAAKTIAQRLQPLIGTKFPLTGKSRTDGSSLRKLIAATLFQYDLPPEAPEESYFMIPEKGKGIPKLTREFLDTYIITSGKSYNLQVWNRIPNSDDIQIEYLNGKNLLAKDVRFVLIKIDITNHTIAAILVLTPDYIVEHFGKFGSPTIKHQLLVSHKMRARILNNQLPIYSKSDTKRVAAISAKKYSLPTQSFNEIPEKGQVFSIEVLIEKVAKELIGQKIDANSTKNRGQALELLCIQKLGYQVPEKFFLEGGYPDIRNQLLEIKIQDTQTVDLGKYTPEIEENILPSLNITTKDIRYFIALMNKETMIIEGIIICPGMKLGTDFNYVDGVSGKCQRAIKMSFFDKYIGQSVFNPAES